MTSGVKRGHTNFGLLQIREGVIFQGSAINLKLLNDLDIGGPEPSDSSSRSLEVTEVEIVFFKDFSDFSIISCDHIIVAQRPHISQVG